MTIGRPGRWAAVALSAAATAWLISAPAGDIGTVGARALAALAPGEGRPTSADVDRVRADIEAALAGMTWRVRTAGDVIVAERDGAFHIVVPAVVVDGRDGRALDVGDVEIVAAPRSDGRYDARVVVPATMGLIDENGAWTGRLTVGEQRFEGVWAPEFGFFIELDAAWRDIRVAASDGPPALIASGASVAVDYRETAPGLWGGQSSFAMSGIEIAGGDDGGRVTIGSLEAGAGGADMRFAEMGRFAREVDAVARDLDGSDPADALPLLLSMFSTMPSLYADASLEVAVTNVVVEDPAGGLGFALDRVVFEGVIEGLDEARSRVAMRYEHDGLEVAANETIASAFVPRRMVFDAAAVDLPNQALRQAMADYAREATTTAPDRAGAMLADRLVAALSDGASKVVLNRLTVDASGMGLNAGGALRSDPTAAFGAVGEFDTTIRGLDGLMASLSAAPGDPSAMRTVMIMAMVHALGEPGVDGDGEPTRRYRFEITAGGAVLLNGADTRGLFGDWIGQ